MALPVAGRALLISIDDFAGGAEVEIAGQTTGNITVNKEPIDVTSKSDLGVRQLLADAGTFSCEISFETVAKAKVLAPLGFDAAPTALGAVTVDIDQLGTITGNFFLSNYGLSGGDGTESVGESATLMSAGAVTFTAAV